MRGKLCLLYDQTAPVHLHLAGKGVLAGFGWCDDDLRGLAHRQISSDPELVEHYFFGAGARVFDAG